MFFALALHTMDLLHLQHDLVIHLLVLGHVGLSPELRIFLPGLRRFFDSGLVDEESCVENGQVVVHQTEFVHLSHFILEQIFKWKKSIISAEIELHR